MRGDEERQEKGLLLVEMPAQQGGENDTVPEAGDGKQLGNPLYDAEDDGLKIGHNLPYPH